MTDLYVASPTGSGQVAQWMGQAIGLFQAGRLQEADSLCRRMAETEPGNAEIFNLWAAVVLQGGHPDAAAQLLARAIELKGGQREYHHNLGNVLRGLGRLDEAAACFQNALNLEPQAVDSAFELGLTLLDLGRPLEAAPLFRAIISAVPGVTDGYFRLGVAHLQTGANQPASAAFRHALACQSDLSDAQVNLAILAREEGRIEEAMRGFRAAAALRPEDPFILSNISNLLREMGREDGPVGALERAVLLAPEEAEFHYSLAASRTYRRDDWRLSALEALAGKLPTLDRQGQIHVHFALSKAYEDIGEPEKSFLHQEAGNALHRAGQDYDEEAYIAGVLRIRDAFTPELIARLGGTGDSSASPIFVVGMPRSGSSLVEQILASHAGVFGAGEIPDLPLLARALGPDDGPFFPEFVHEMIGADMSRVGRAYIERVRARAPEATRIVDKLPENYRLIGLIHCALPGAKIIHTRRNAVDTCLSIYSKLFTSDLPYSYRLDEIGRYWRAYDTLMAHWRAVLPPGAFYDLDYEALVADQEGETRKLLDFCGLEWSDAVLQFHETRRVVKTASSHQVRKPLYSSSVGRWRPAGDQLAPLMAGLDGR